MAFYDVVMDVIASAQTEIVIFLVAVCAHFVLFSKHTVHGKSGAKKIEKEGPKAASDKTSPRKAAADSACGPLVRSVQALVADRAGQDALAAELNRSIGQRPLEERAELVAGVLSSLGKSVSREVVGAARSVAQNLEGAAHLNEMILRSYTFLRAKKDFDDFFDEVSASSEVSPAMRLIALRAACTFGDLQAAFKHLPGVAPAWRAGATASPSVACHQLFQQMARLVMVHGELPRLMEEMKTHSLVSGGTVQALLQECARTDRLEELEQVKELAIAAKIDLTPGCYVALLRCAQSAGDALERLQDAATREKLNKEVLVAGVSVAAKFSDKEIADFVLASSSSASGPEVAQGLLQLCAKGGPLERGHSDALIFELYESRVAGTGFGLEARAERLVAEAALRHGREAVLKSLLSQPTEVSRQVFLIKSFSQDRRLQDCLSIFRACAEKSVPLCNAMLDACVDNGDLELAEALMGEAVEEKIADIVTYNTMIKAYLRKGGLARAKQMLQSMQRKGLKPNCVTYNELLDGVVRERPEAMWSIVGEMQAAGCKPNHITCSIVLKSVSKASRANEVEKALAVVDAMEDPMDEVLLSSVCEACIRSGRTDLLHRQLERQKGVQIKGAQTYGSVIRAYGSLNDIDKVWDTWREMRKRGIVPTSVTIGCMVEALASNGQVEAAHELIREQMEDPEVRPLVNAIIYCSVLKGFSHRKRFDRVWAVYEEMKAAGLQCSIVTFNTLVDACARSGDMARIPTLLEDMAKQGIEPNLITYSAIIKGYCQDNRLDRAFELLDDMKRNLNLNPDEVTYNTLIDGCARYGMYDRGVGVLREMEEMGVPPSNFTLSVLVKLANRSKRPQKAFELCDTLCAKYNLRLCVHVYDNLIHACTSHGDYAKAFEVAAQMLRERVRPDTRTYALLLRAAVSERSHDDVAGLLRAAARLPGAHPTLLAAVGGAAALAPKGGLPREVVSEALEGLAGFASDDTSVVQLLRELRSAPGVSVDPRLPMRLTSQAAKR